MSNKVIFLLTCVFFLCVGFVLGYEYTSHTQQKLTVAVKPAASQGELFLTKDQVDKIITIYAVTGKVRNVDITGLNKTLQIIGKNNTVLGPFKVNSDTIVFKKGQKGYEKGFLEDVHNGDTIEVSINSTTGDNGTIDTFITSIRIQ